MSIAKFFTIVVAAIATGTILIMIANAVHAQTKPYIPPIECVEGGAIVKEAITTRTGFFQTRSWDGEYSNHYLSNEVIANITTVSTHDLGFNILEWSLHDRQGFLIVANSMREIVALRGDFCDY